MGATRWRHDPERLAPAGGTDTASDSLTRYRNLRARATEAKGSIDAGRMVDIFDPRLFNPDGTLKEGGGATKPTNQDVDLTVQQIATKPSTREVWLKVPLKTKWRHVGSDDTDSNCQLPPRRWSRHDSAAPPRALLSLGR